MASHNELRGPNHIPDFPAQAEITAFLRGLLKDGRTQVSWAADAGIAYNTLTNYFTAAAPKMSAENLLRLVVAADAVPAFGAWLANYGGTFHTAAVAPSGAHDVNQSDDFPPIMTGFLAISPEDQADLEAHEAARRGQKRPPSARPPSASTPGAGSRSPAKRGGHGGKGKGR